MRENNMTARKAARRASMAEMLSFITDNPGCVAYEISKSTGLSHSEVSRYIRWKRMEWRPLYYLMELREKNPPLYKHLLHDGIFQVRDNVDGMLINTSKREIFDRYCLNQGYNLSVDRLGRCYLYDFGTPNSSNEKKFVLRMFDISTDDQKNRYEGRVCQVKLPLQK